MKTRRSCRTFSLFATRMGGSAWSIGLLVTVYFTNQLTRQVRQAVADVADDYIALLAGASAMGGATDGQRVLAHFATKTRETTQGMAPGSSRRKDVAL